jgi:hypothetical protein
MSPHCTTCSRSWSDVDHGPMLFAASWSKIAEKHEHLCAECFFDRLTALKVEISLADLRPCPFNVMLSPHDWFDFYAKVAPPELVATWQRWLERQSSDWLNSRSYVPTSISVRRLSMSDRRRKKATVFQVQQLELSFSM